MNVLYLGGYKERYKRLFKHVKTAESILELCFGDLLLAEYCKNNNIAWTGLDINEAFVKRATRKGFNAFCNDINGMDFFPKAKLIVIAGSFYHFAENADNLLKKMIEASENIIISEPVVNISAQNGLLGFIARYSANTGKKHELFRYNEKSLLGFLDKNKVKMGFNYKIIERYRKDIIIEIIK
jgi:hypothetical protein